MFLALIVYITMVVLPSLKAASAISAGLLAIVAFCLGFAWLISGAGSEGDSQKVGEFTKKVFKSWIAKVMMAMCVFGLFIPDQKTTWYIVGAYAAEQVATADVTKELAGDTKDLFLDLIKKARENINSTDATELAKKVGNVVKETAK